MSAPPLLRFDNISRIFHTPRGDLPAVDGVSFDVPAGEVLCLVGESGCGKTTTGKMAAMLLKPSSGRILVEGKDIWALPEREFKFYRKAIQLIHQDPYASLNPVHSIYTTLSAPLFRHKAVRSRQQAIERIVELLRIVGLTPPEDFLYKYPHQLSGGQRQRVSVARALTVDPRLIVADEAVSMVDVSLRVSLLNMLRRLKDQLGVTFLFITHDLAVARYFAAAGRIGVMYLGRMVELGPTPQVIGQPEHPYTRALLSAIPEADPLRTRKKDLSALRSIEVPSLLNLPPGCTFHPRCPLFEQGLCDVVVPELTPISARRGVSCHVAVRAYGKDVADGQAAPAAATR
jgi:oligopeptide/dipeptide ABC transporter ATP-binding protein